MKKIFLLFNLLLVIASVAAQDAKFGGPFTNLSFNERGPQLSVGGGGTFIVKGNYYIGIFGQTTTDAFIRSGDEDHSELGLNSRQTGFWFGYNHRFRNNPRFSTSLYNKVGFGQVQLEDSEQNHMHYDGTIMLTPNIEIAYQFASFFELGIAAHYEFHTGVDLFHYTHSDFNSYGISLLFKFKAD
jgi:hypothetical protein